jgi:hypothetical protein
MQNPAQRANSMSTMDDIKPPDSDGSWDGNHRLPIRGDGDDNELDLHPGGNALRTNGKLREEHIGINTMRDGTTKI